MQRMENFEALQDSTFPDVGAIKVPERINWRGFAMSSGGSQSLPAASAVSTRRQPSAAIALLDVNWQRGALTDGLSLAVRSNLRLHVYLADIAAG